MAGATSSLPGLNVSEMHAQTTFATVRSRADTRCSCSTISCRSPVAHVLAPSDANDRARLKRDHRGTKQETCRQWCAEHLLHVQLPGLIPSAFAAQRLASSSEQQSPLATGSQGQYGPPSTSAQDDLLAAQMQGGVGSHALPLTRHRSASCEFERCARSSFLAVQCFCRTAARCFVTQRGYSYACPVTGTCAARTERPAGPSRRLSSRPFAPANTCQL